MSNGWQPIKRCNKENISVSPPHEDNEHKQLRTPPLIRQSTSTVDLRTISISAPMALSSTSTSEAGPYPQCYLWSPLETLTQSLDDPLAERITLHDLVETYNVICANLKQCLLLGSDSEQVLLAANHIKQRTPQLVNALRRDMMRVLVDPCLSEHGLQASDGAINEDEMQYARDVAMVCHQALRLLSDIVSFPALVSAFSHQELTFLLESIMTILSKPSLPTPHSGRTYSLLLWILRVQRLPADVLLPRKETIVTTVKRALSGKFMKEKAVGDSLKIIANLLRDHAIDFMASFSELLSGVLPFLVADSLDIRLGAAHALSAFAYAKLELPPPKGDHRHSQLSDTVHRFLSAQFFVSGSKLSLLTILRSSIKMSKKPVHRGTGPQWAAVVISSFVILLDSWVFDYGHVLQKVLKLLSDFSAHRRNSVQLLLAPIWKCLVWAFSRMPRYAGSSKEVNTKWGKAFGVLKQELGGGIGVALSSVALMSDDDKSVSDVLDMISIMLDGKESEHEAGLLLLARLTESIGNANSSASSIVQPITFLNRELFNGELLDTKPELLKFSVEPMHRFNTDIVRRLTEEEISTHWDKMLGLWVNVVRAALGRPEPKFPKPLFDVWQALLLVESQLTQNNGHLTASTDFTLKVAGICAEFAAIRVDLEFQVQQLHLLCKLWHTVKAVFVNACFEEPATLLLSAIVRRDFGIADSAIHSAWASLCQEIVYSDVNLRPDVTAVDMKTWVAVAKLWTNLEEELCKSNLVAFLESPFPEHLASDAELSLWDTLFRKILSVSGSSLESEITERPLWKRFVQQDEDHLSLFPKQLYVVITAVDIPIGTTLPSKILSLLRKTLCGLYPPRSDLLDTALHYINFVRGMMSSVPLELLVSFLAVLQDGLCCWFKDHLKVIPDKDYNNTVVPLFCSALDRLVMVEPTKEALLTLWRFFVFPLFRCPAPGLAPQAFEKFWRSTYHKHEEFHSAYPEDLVASLLAYDQVFCAGLATAISQSEDSQGACSYVPESICSPRQPQEVCNMTQRLEPIPERSTVDLDADEEHTPGHSPSGHPTAADVPTSDDLGRSPPRHSNTHQDSSPVSALNREWAHDISEVQRTDCASNDGSGRKRRRNTEEVADAKPSPSQHKENTSTASARSSKRRILLDYVEVRRAGLSKRSRESQLMTPEPSRFSSMGASSPGPMSPQEDYGSWEEAIHSSGTRQLTCELDVDSPSATGIRMADYSKDILNSPSLRVTAKRRKTESELDSREESRAPPPLRRNKTTSATLDDLQRAFNAYTNDGVDIPIEELVMASKLVHQFGTALSDQIARRLSPCETG